MVHLCRAGARTASSAGRRPSRCQPCLTSEEVRRPKCRSRRSRASRRRRSGTWGGKRLVRWPARARRHDRGPNPVALGCRARPDDPRRGDISWSGAAPKPRGVALYRFRRGLSGGRLAGEDLGRRPRLCVGNHPPERSSCSAGVSGSITRGARRLAEGQARSGVHRLRYRRPVAVCRIVHRVAGGAKRCPPISVSGSARHSGSPSFVPAACPYNGHAGGNDGDPRSVVVPLDLRPYRPRLVRLRWGLNVKTAMGSNPSWVRIPRPPLRPVARAGPTGRWASCRRAVTPSHRPR